jgi:raffinose/stachyose/melibiose transport system permease protein
MSHKQQQKLIIIGFLTVPLLLLVVFSLYPAVYLVYLSFMSWDGFSPEKTWAGLANYREFFGNKEMLQVLSHNFVYLIWGLFQVALGLFFALLLNTKLRGRNAYRVILFAPYIMNGVAVAYMFNYVFNSEYGSLNALLNAIGLESLATSWFGRPGLVNHVLASIGVWKWFGFNMVLFLAALQSINTDMIEAARIDGANRRQITFNIIIPNIIRIIELNLFLTVTGSLEVFELPFLLTSGGPLGSSETFVTQTIDTAFEYYNFGLASAMSTVLVVIVAIVLTLQKFVIRRWE